MLRLRPVLLCVVLLVVSGCATAPAIDNENQNQQLKTQLKSLEAEIAGLKEENAQLKAQLETIARNKKEIRMPNATEIQTALKKAGFYKGAIDGQIGTQTKEAIRKFQEANKINPDGIVGSRTWAVLSKFLGDSRMQ